MLHKTIKKVESSLSDNQKLGIGVALVASIILLTVGLIDSKTDPVYNSVMITGNTIRGGGSGVVISSSDYSSIVLTNAHVCELVSETGGTVTNSKQTFSVTHTKTSLQHDLCLIQVNGDFHTSTKIASKEPKAFYERAVVAGHPNLLPTVVTSGHFSGRQVIKVATGFRECTGADYEAGLALICALMGGKLPIVKNFESVLVTSTIMAGSSGSAVYNEAGELSGLVFAGKGDLSYAFTVPYTAVKRFMEVEQSQLDFKPINNSVDITAILRQRSLPSDELTEKFEHICQTSTDAEIKRYCNRILGDMIYRGE